jgi:cytoskeletal protein CcmA (bactofilin family)
MELPTTTRRLKMFEMNPLKRNAGRPTDVRETEPTSTPMPPKPQTHERSAGLATIGPSIYIKGDLTGEEDLIIQGHVEGTINLKQNNLTIGQEGKISANIFARTITIEGFLKGDVLGEEKVLIKKTGNVHGNVTAPRISLEDGAKFKGSMDMDYKRTEPTAARNDSSSASVVKLDKTPGAEKPSFDAKGAIK